MGNKLVLIGGGGHCKSVLDAVKRTNQFDEIVITDPQIAKGSELLGCIIVGTDDELVRLKDEGFEFAFITLGSILSTTARRRLVKKAEDIGFIFPIIKDPSATVCDSVSIENGAFIGKNVVINADAKVEKHAIVNTGAIIEHDCVIGAFSHVSVGAVLCGSVTVGSDSFIGAGTTVIQQVCIGDRVVIGANSTVLSDVSNDLKMYGIIDSNKETKRSESSPRSPWGGYRLTSSLLLEFQCTCTERRVA